MWKKVFLFAVLLVAVLLAFQFYTSEETSKNNDPSPKKPSEDDVQTVNPKELTAEIFSLAKEGKVLHTPFIAGETEMEDVKKKWGEPQDIEEHARGDYANYPDHSVTIGYQDSLAFDLRSYHDELQEIHLNDIKAAKGEPDDISYYKDVTVDQIILIYQVAENLQLKWILLKPTDNEPNPAVHHVAIFAKINPADSKAISKVIDEMSLDEKIGQMIFAGISGTTMTDSTNRLINTYQVGGIIFYKNNISTSQQIVELQNDIQAANVNNRLPLLLGVDQEGGRISRLPSEVTNLPASLAIGNVNNPSYSYDIGRLLGKELKAFGFNLDFAPVLDVNSNPRNPVIGDRSFGDNPEIVSSLGMQTMKGIQSQNVIPVVKHFPGHGDTSVDSHLELPTVNKTLSELEQLELIPFKAAIENGADVVMAAHILLPKIDSSSPSSMSKVIITDILRQQLGFDGVVITDDMTMGAIADNFSIAQAAVASVKAGSDIILVAHGDSNIISSISALKSAVESGEITEERINESVARIIHLKNKYKLENSKVQTVNVEQLNQSISQVLSQYK